MVMPQHGNFSRTWVAVFREGYRARPLFFRQGSAPGQGTWMSQIHDPGSLQTCRPASAKRSRRAFDLVGATRALRTGRRSFCIFQLVPGAATFRPKVFAICECCEECPQLARGSARSTSSRSSDAGRPSWAAMTCRAVSVGCRFCVSSKEM